MRLTVGEGTVLEIGFDLVGQASLKVDFVTDHTTLLLTDVEGSATGASAPALRLDRGDSGELHLYLWTGDEQSAARVTVSAQPKLSLRLARSGALEEPFSKTIRFTVE